VAQHFRMPIALSQLIDDWIARQPDPKPSRPEAVRRLVEKALERDGARASDEPKALAPDELNASNDE
jgi:hypothetical protein